MLYLLHVDTFFITFVGKKGFTKININVSYAIASVTFIFEQ